MAVEKVKVPLTEREYVAILRLCELEVRPLDDEMRFLLRQELVRRELLETQNKDEVAT